MPTVRLATAGLLAILVASAWWLFGSRPPAAAPPTAGDQIIAFGDSLIQGVGASPGRDLVSELSRRLGVSIINAGRSGDTTAQALRRLDRDVLGRRPRVVLVLVGGNDILRRVPREVTFNNLNTIVTRIRQAGAAVVIVAVDVGFLTSAYAREFEELADRTSSALVPDILDGLLGRRDLMADGIHPNDRGYALIADRLEPVLAPLVRPTFQLGWPSRV
jgi:acyl-CoA thioesterase I